MALFLGSRSKHLLKPVLLGNGHSLEKTQVVFFSVISFQEAVFLLVFYVIWLMEVIV